MAISVTNIGTASGATGTTLAVAVPGGGVPNGALVIVIVDENATTIGGSISDLLNTYTATTGAFNNNASASGFGRMFYSENITGLAAAAAITYTRQTLNSAAAMTCLYVTGTATSSSLDTAVTAVVTGTGTSPSVTSGTPSQSGDLFIAFATWKSSPGSFSQDTGHGWAIPPNNAQRVSAGIGGGNQVNAGTSTIIFSPTLTSAPYTVQIYGFKVAVSGTIGAPYYYRYLANGINM